MFSHYIVHKLVDWLSERTPGFVCTLSNRQDGRAVHCASAQLLVE